ncbi:Shedu anti-phage system protein SduA domain-containing protein [Sorangium sp. So ce131]|uniref:Shedu anti-phage system protein SduA domain-containing protein n=1 Tax=Sorangium sp. So ce131 TaxID=3133282 RepID=UPI003F60C548
MNESAPKRILLVEDDDQNAEDYTGWLQAKGYEVARAAAAEDGVALASSVRPDVVLLDLQIPSQPGRADASTDQGLKALEGLLRGDPFRPVVVATAHSRNRELMREVMQRNRGGQFLFKDERDLRNALFRAVAIALESPVYVASRAVRAFEALVAQSHKEEVYRDFLKKNWRVILGPKYRDCRSPHEVGRGAKVDLMFVRHDGFPDLWELKRPDQPVFQAYNSRLHQSEECSRAVGQLIEYIDLAEKERGGPGSYEALRGVHVDLRRPRGFVVIGRRKDDRERDRLALENRFLAGITVFTYDDVIEGAREILTFLRDYRNGDADP